MTQTTATESTLKRRGFIRRGGGLVLSGTAIAMLGGLKPKLAHAATESAFEQDINILNTAINAEFEAVAAYQLGADSGLLTSEVKNVALTFQSHHKAHADVLVSTVEQLGGKPNSAKSRYNFPVDKLKAQKDVLEFAAGLEHGAISAYAGAIPLFDNRDLMKAASSILADEAMHWAVLRQALGLEPVPGPFIS